MEQWKLAAVMGAVALGGVAVGGWLFGAQHARAQQAAFTECFIARQENLDTNDQGEIAARDAAHEVRVPPGYTPIAGGGYGWRGDQGAIVFCR